MNIVYLFSFALNAAECSNLLHWFVFTIGRIYTDFDEIGLCFKLIGILLLFPFIAKNIQLPLIWGAGTLTDELDWSRVL